MSSATFKSSGGGTPEQHVLSIAKGAVPTEGDALYAVQRQRTRIIDRTINGVDVDGNPFEPYSTKGPYYYYPNGRVGKNKIEARKNRAAVNRLIKRIGEIEDFTGHDIGGIKTRDGQGIKFENYAMFKRSLGRRSGTVDLLGPRAPHMLQAIAVGVRFERIYSDEQSFSVFDRPEPATQAVIGVYGAEAGRAEGHNTGNNPRWRGSHQRRFLGASVSDIEAMIGDISKRILERIKILTTR